MSDSNVEGEWFLHRRKLSPDSPLFASSSSDEDGSDGHTDIIVDQENDYVEGHQQLSCSLLDSFNQVSTDFPLTSPKTPRGVSPKTPTKSPWGVFTPRTPTVECPGAPNSRSSRSMVRQSSLNETKLLMTTQLKRTFSSFLFDKHFEFLREVGRGSSSKVYEARDRRSGSQCAVKISKQPFCDREDRDKFLREIQSVACLPEHPNVVKYYRGWQQNSHFHIQMELCDGGSLRNYLNSIGRMLEESEVWSFIHQVACGLEHIHLNGVLHLDIKPENILLCGEGRLKICDFGLAVQRQNLQDWEEGDGAYVAPELLRDQEPGPEADMFSFGVMVYEWAAHELLPRPNPEVQLQITLPVCRSKALCSLVTNLLQPDPSQRPTATQVLKWKYDL